MKRILLVLLLLAGSIQLKAQQLLQLKPDLKLSNGLQHYFRPDSVISPKDFLLHGNQNQSEGVITFHSNMPIAKLSGTDRMPVVVPGEPGVKYTMLIKKITVIDPAVTAPKQAP